jgi:hypothetical protein
MSEQSRTELQHGINSPPGLISNILLTLRLMDTGWSYFNNKVSAELLVT